MTMIADDDPGYAAFRKKWLKIRKKMNIDEGEKK